MKDHLSIHGHFQMDCRIGGDLIWTRDFDNVVATVGKNLAFNTFLNGSNYTVTGPYIGLISGQGFTGVAATDTMSSHPGWVEAGNANPPTILGTRNLCVWQNANAGSIQFVGPSNFVPTEAGVIQGAFIVYGSGAVNTIDNTGGTLWSAGVFQGGAQTIPVGSTLQVYYLVSM